MEEMLLGARLSEWDHHRDDRYIAAYQDIPTCSSSTCDRLLSDDNPHPLRSRAYSTCSTSYSWQNHCVQGRAAGALERTRASGCVQLGYAVRARLAFHTSPDRPPDRRITGHGNSRPPAQVRAFSDTR
jgi:hypothetical protein